MTLEECYEKFGGDYSETLERLVMPELVEKYLRRFLKDPCYNLLVESFREDGSRDREAFQAVHTLKGLCLNLGLTPLTRSSSALTEALRDGRKPGAEEMFVQVKKDYAAVSGAICELVGA